MSSKQRGLHGHCFLKKVKKMTFVVASNNSKKIEEIHTVVTTIGHNAISAKEAGIEIVPEETENTFLGNATIKATAFKRLTDLAVIADDSGLMVEALGGFPGVKTARYASDNPTDDENIEKLLEELEGIGIDDRTAWFVSTVVAILPDFTTVSATGYVRGYIGYEKRGNNGFGYDPIFYIKGNRSFAEISSATKNSISHRGRALRKLIFKLRNISKMKGYI